MFAASHERVCSLWQQRHTAHFQNIHLGGPAAVDIVRVVVCKRHSSSSQGCCSHLERARYINDDSYTNACTLPISLTERGPVSLILFVNVYFCFPIYGYGPWIISDGAWADTLFF